MKQRGPLGGQLVRVQGLRVQAELGLRDGGGGHGAARGTGGGGLVLRGERNLEHCVITLAPARGGGWSGQGPTQVGVERLGVCLGGGGQGGGGGVGRRQPA